MAQTVGSRSTDEERLAELGYNQELTRVVGAWWLLSARHTIKGPVRTVEFDDGLSIADPEQERVG